MIPGKRPPENQAPSDTRPGGERRICFSVTMHMASKKTESAAFSGAHFATGKKAKPHRRRVVSWEKRKRRETSKGCGQCEAGLCLGGYFKNHHTNLLL